MADVPELVVQEFIHQAADACIMPERETLDIIMKTGTFPETLGFQCMRVANALEPVVGQRTVICFPHAPTSAIRSIAIGAVHSNAGTFQKLGGLYNLICRYLADAEKRREPVPI